MTYKIWSAVTNCLICGLGLRRNGLPVGIRAKLTNLLSCYCKLIRITSYKFSLPALGAHINFDLERSMKCGDNCHFERSTKCGDNCHFERSTQCEAEKSIL